MRKNVMKMTLLVLLISTMCFGMLTACGNTTNTANVADVATEEVATEEVATEEVATEDQSTLEMLSKLKELEPKNAALVDMYNEIATLAVENGWDADELTLQELNAVDAAILGFNEMLTTPSSAVGVDLDTILTSVDGLITELDTNIRARVSVPYVAE